MVALSTVCKEGNRPTLSSLPFPFIFVRGAK